MEVKIKPFGALPCALETFSINGIRADQDDFGITFSDNSGQYDEQKYQAVQQAIIDQFGD